MKNLISGDQVDLNGYDFMAQINHREGEAAYIVVHNNSTHVILAKSEQVAGGQDFAPLAEFVASARYGDNEPYDNNSDFGIAYALMLARAFQLALDVKR